ncbi:hypothetical protein ACTXT7_001650 [Hymenolepis weldensis]
MADLIRFERETREVPPGRRLLGRIFLSLIRPAVVERINLMSDRETTNVTHLPVNVILPSQPTLTTARPVPTIISTLDPGRNAIPYSLYVSETEMPYFAYVHPKTGIVKHLLSTEPNNIHRDNTTAMCPRKYCVRENVVKVAVGDIFEQTKSAEARITSRETCRAGNVVEELEIVECKKLEAVQAPKSELLREMGLRAGAR